MEQEFTEFSEFRDKSLKINIFVPEFREKSIKLFTLI